MDSNSNKPEVEHVEYADGHPQDEKNLKGKPLLRRRWHQLLRQLYCLLDDDDDDDSNSLHSIHIVPIAEGPGARLGWTVEEGSAEEKHRRRRKMKKFGFGKRSDSDDSSSTKSSIFGRKKESADQNDNPYAQSSQIAEDPYAAPMTPFQKAKAGLPSGPRPGGVGLPSGPGPRAGSRPGPGGPPPPYSDQPQSSNSGYGSEKFGTQGGYGSNRYDYNANAYGGNSQYSPAANVPSPSTSAVSSRPGGYGGMGAEDDGNRDSSFAGAKSRYVAPPQSDPSTSNEYGRGGPSQASAAYGSRYDDEQRSGAKDRYAQQQPAAYGDSSASSGNDAYDGYGEPREMTEEELEEQEVDAHKADIKRLKKEGAESTDRSVQAALRAEEIGRGVFARLAVQRESLFETENNLHKANIENSRAEEGTKQLNHYNRSMFAVRVSNPFTAKERREQAEQAKLERLARERQEREAIRSDAYRNNQQMEQHVKGFDAVPVGRTGSDSRGGRAVDRSKYEFEEDDESQALEDRIDQNLDVLERTLPKLHRLAVALDEEVDSSIAHVEKISDMSDFTHKGVDKNRSGLARAARGKY